MPLVGIGHLTMLVGLTAAAVLQASNLMITRRRVVHRLAGTVIGVGLAFAPRLVPADLAGRDRVSEHGHRVAGLGRNRGARASCLVVAGLPAAA